jgi:hypothetical protein
MHSTYTQIISSNFQSFETEWPAWSPKSAARIREGIKEVHDTHGCLESPRRISNLASGESIHPEMRSSKSPRVLRIECSLLLVDVQRAIAMSSPQPLAKSRRACSLVSNFTLTPLYSHLPNPSPSVPPE